MRTDLGIQKLIEEEKLVSPKEFFAELTWRNLHKVAITVFAWLVDQDHGSLNYHLRSCGSITLPATP
jgi:hypothetical protein